MSYSKELILVLDLNILKKFLKTQSDILLHPVFGYIKDPIPVKATISKPKTTTLRMSKRGSSFVTSVTRADERTSKEASKDTHVAVLTLCNFCQGKHALTNCTILKSESQAKNVEYLKRNLHCSILTMWIQSWRLRQPVQNQNKWQ